MLGGYLAELKAYAASIPSQDDLALQRVANALAKKQAELSEYDGSCLVDGLMQRHISAEIRGLERQQRAIQERIADRQRVFGRDR